MTPSHKYGSDKLETHRVYYGIKSLIIEHALPLGKRILVEPLADQFKVSNTPVREALIQLASERLIRDEPNAGFFTKEISELEIRNLYILNQSLLDLSLSLVRNDGQVPGMLKPPNIVFENEHIFMLPPRTLVQKLHTLFVHIARQSGNADILHGIKNINDRTQYVRQHECLLLKGWQTDLVDLCQLYHLKKIEELRSALKLYHSKVIAFLPDLLLLIKRSDFEIQHPG